MKQHKTLDLFQKTFNVFFYFDLNAHMKHVHDTFKVLQLSFHPNNIIHCNIWLLIKDSKFYIHTCHNAPVKQ